MTDLYLIDAPVSKQVDAKNELFIQKIVSKSHPRHFNKDGSLRYNYDKLHYINNHSYIILTCSDHGDFQIIPSNHLKGGACPRCAKTSPDTIDDFIEKSNKIHKGFYDYSESVYKNTRTEIKIKCPKHGYFNQLARTHVLGGGCRACAGNNRLSNDYFITKSITQHGNKYDYSKVDYKSHSHKVTIICPYHGDFKQSPDSHMRGKGCDLCGQENQGWSKSAFKRACQNNNGLARLYVIKCSSDTEVFYKIGITSRPINHRFSGIDAMPYNYKVIYEIIKPCSDIWDLEVEILRAYYSHKYLPKISFGGCTECISSIDGIERYLG